MNDDDDKTLTAEGAARRRFLYGTGALTTGLATSLAPVAAIAATPHEAAARTPGAPVPVRLNVNGLAAQRDRLLVLALEQRGVTEIVECVGGLRVQGEGALVFLTRQLPLPERL